MRLHCLLLRLFGFCHSRGAVGLGGAFGGIVSVSLGLLGGESGGFLLCYQSSGSLLGGTLLGCGSGDCGLTLGFGFAVLTFVVGDFVAPACERQAVLLKARTSSLGALAWATMNMLAVL